MTQERRLIDLESRVENETLEGNNGSLSHRIESNSWWKMFSSLDLIDREYSEIIHRWEFGLWDILVIIPGTIFGVWGVPFLVIWYYWVYQSPLFLVGVIVTTIINESLKHVFKRVRPDPNKIGKKIIDLRKVHNNPSMPSGDTAQASVMAVTLLYHGYSYLWLLVIPIGAFGRIYFGSHFIGDCIVGAILGVISAYAVNYYMYVPEF